MNIAQDILGVSVTYLKGKSTRQQGDAVELNIEIIMPIPPEILSAHGTIIISVDIMKVNGVPFLTSISRVVNFGLATEIPSADMDNVMVVLTVIFREIQSKGVQSSINSGRQWM